MPDKHSVTIKTGQIWRDKDRRRKQQGNIRTFEVTLAAAPGMVGCDWVTAKDVKTGKLHMFKRSRFGSGAMNDSFELARDINA